MKLLNTLIWYVALTLLSLSAYAQTTVAGYSTNINSDKPNADAINKSDLWVSSNEKGIYTVEFVNSGEVVALQFDIPAKGITEKDFKCPSKFSDTDHIVGCVITDQDTIRVAIMSLTNSIVPDHTLLTFASSKFDAKPNASDMLQKVVFSDGKARNVTPNHLTHQTGK